MRVQFQTIHGLQGHDGVLEELNEAEGATRFSFDNSEGYADLVIISHRDLEHYANLSKTETGWLLKAKGAKPWMRTVPLHG